MSNISVTSDFRVKATLWVALTTLVLVSPLSINHFVQGRNLLGISSFIVVVMFATNAFYCSRGHYLPVLTFASLVPSVTLFLAYAFQDLPIVCSFWCYPAISCFYFMLPERLARLANIVFLAVMLPRGWQILDPSLAIRFTVTLAAVSIFSSIFIRMINKQQTSLEAQVATDPLTGLLNRTLLNDMLDHAVQQYQRIGAPMTLVALDLDRFKEINDNRGHAAGDEVLKRVGKLLRARIRRSDKIFRMGGEEFLALLFDTGIGPAQTLAEELRSTIESESLLPDYRVTVSIGVATLHSGENWDEWMKRCDDKLYRAKLKGRNQVVGIEP